MADTSLTFSPVSSCMGEALAALRVEVMRPSLERIGRFDAERARARFLDSFVPEYTREILESGIRVGFFMLRPRDAGLWLDHLYIRPPHQGRGIGAAVLCDVFAQGDAVRLEVRVGALKGSEANRFYVRHGFVLESEAEFDNYYVRKPACDLTYRSRPTPSGKVPRSVVEIACPAAPCRWVRLTVTLGRAVDSAPNDRLLLGAGEYFRRGADISKEEEAHLFAVLCRFLNEHGLSRRRRFPKAVNPGMVSN